MPFIIGIVIVGGILILLTKDDDKKEPEAPKLKDNNADSTSVETVNVEEIRRLRRELRHQLAQKKKNNKGEPSS